MAPASFLSCLMKPTEEWTASKQCPYKLCRLPLAKMSRERFWSIHIKHPITSSFTWQTEVATRCQACMYKIATMTELSRRGVKRD